MTSGQKGALVGAIALFAALWVQNAIQNDDASIVQMLTWLLLGALIGWAVARWRSRKT